MASRHLPSPFVLREDAAISAELWRRRGTKARREALVGGCVLATCVVAFAVLFSNFGEHIGPGFIVLLIGFGLIGIAVATALRPGPRAARCIRFGRQSLVVKEHVGSATMRVYYAELWRCAIKHRGPTGVLLHIAAGRRPKSRRRCVLYLPAGENLDELQQFLHWLTPPTMSHLELPGLAAGSAQLPERKIWINLPWRVHLATYDYRSLLGGCTRFIIWAGSVLAIWFAVCATLIFVLASETVGTFVSEVGRGLFEAAPAVAIFVPLLLVCVVLGRFRSLSEHQSRWQTLHVQRRQVGHHDSALCVRWWAWTHKHGPCVCREVLLLPRSVDLEHLDAWIDYINAESARKRRAFGWEGSD